MNEFFVAQETIDEYISAIWTERYSRAGDIAVVCGADSDLVDRLKEGTFVGLRGSNEVMQIQTQNIEKGVMRIVGVSLTQFLDERFLWAKNPDSSAADSRVVDLTVTGKPGAVISDVVSDMVIATTPFGGLYAPAELQWDLEEIAGLTLGDIDTSGVDERITLPIGPLYQAIAQVAEKYGVGISLYLEEAKVDTGYVLKFKTYRGVDRTYDQAVVPPIRLRPDMDSLSDIKELNSINGYKNTVYVYYEGEITVHYEDPLNIPEGFNRRVLVTDAEGEPIGRKVTYDRRWYGGPSTYTTYVVGPAEKAAFRAQHAKDVLANHNYIRAIDGQTSPDSEFKFGEDYGLGDVIELESFTGNVSKARVTEFIRAQDKIGEREYPTISVI